jgi:hypothetical protein
VLALNIKVPTQSPQSGIRPPCGGKRRQRVVEVGFAELSCQGPDLGAYGVTLAGFLLLQAFGTRRLLTGGAMARGTVVGAEEDSSWGQYGTRSTTYNPVVQFTTADGRTVTFTSAVGYSREPDVGGAVDVRYLPDDPEQAEIDRATLWMLPAAFGVLGGVGLLVAGATVYLEPQVAPAVVDTVGDPETSVPVPTVGGPETSDPVPELRPPPKVASGRIGDKLTVYDELGDAQLEVTVTLKFIRGDAFNQPERGLYMGAYVKAHALADDQFLVSFYARVRGHLYDQAIANPLAFDPQLGGVLLNKGERAAGWLVFDVPARHGQLVLRNLDEQTVGVWKY